MDPVGARLRRIVQDGGRVEPAAQPDAEWDVGNELFLYGFLQQVVEFFAGCIERGRSGKLRFCRNVGGGSADPIPPLEHVAGQELYDSVNQSVGRGNIIQAEIAAESREPNVTGHVGVSEDAFQLRPEIQFVIALEVVEGLDTCAVAGQNQTSL